MKLLSVRLPRQALVLLILLLLLTACQEQTPALPPISEGGAILAFGDSLTYGTGVKGPAAYPTILEQLTGHEVINEGVPGEVSSAGLKRLPKLLDQYQPELLILVHGGNDLLRKVPQDKTRANLTAMIELAKQRSISVIMLGVPEPTLLLLSSADFYQAVADATQTPIDTSALPNILAESDLKSDSFHPNGLGYRKMAEALQALLKRSGALE